MNTNLFFSFFFGHSRDILAKSRDIPPKSLVSLCFSRDIPNFLAPTHACGRPPPHRKVSGPKSLGLASLSFLDLRPQIWSRLKPDYHCGRKRCIINSETFSTCNQHVKFASNNSQDFHVCISYMPTDMLGNDTHVRAMKRISNNFLHVANMYFYSY